MKKLFAKLAVLFLGLATLGSIASNKSTITANATKGKGDEIWSLITSSDSWKEDKDLTYKNSRYEITVYLGKDTEFKIRLNHDWTTSIGYGGNTGGGISTYLTTGSDGNFKVKTSNYYTLIVIDDNVATNYGDKSYGFQIKRAYAVNYYFSSEKLDTKYATDGEAYYPEFFYKAGYRLEGWYKDSNLSNSFEKGTKVSSTLNLYGKYTPAPANFGLYMKNTPKWTTPHVYLWSSKYENNNTWPGKAMTLVTGTDYWYIEIDTEQGFDQIIFNDGKETGAAQTEDLTLSDHTIVYELTVKASTGNQNWKAVEKEVRKVIAHIKGDSIAWEEFKFTGETANTNGFTVLGFNNGKIATIDSTPTEEEKKAALIVRFEQIDTCSEIDNYEELAKQVNDWESIVITDKDKDTGRDTASVSIGDKLNYMRELANLPVEHSAENKLNGVILSLSDNNSSVSLIALFAILGLVAISAYYFIEKKRLAK